MITFGDIRRTLIARGLDHSLPLVEMVEATTFLEQDYKREVNAWLSGEKSTTHLRDVIVDRFKTRPEIIKIGQQFNPTTEWDNTWMPLDTAAYLVKTDADKKRALFEDEMEMRSLPHFGMF